MTELRFFQRFRARAALAGGSCALCLALAPVVGGAATPAGWAAHDKAAAAACAKASGLRDARPLGRPVVFPDDVGYTALQVRGRYPQPHMKNRQGTFLCLYERRSGKAVAEESAAAR